MDVCTQSFLSLFHHNQPLTLPDHTDHKTPVGVHGNNEPRCPQVVAVLGCQWGDEGKGKLVGLISDFADVCCRFNGGSNAGHTLVVKNQRFTFHLLPCGITSLNTENFIGNGVVLHLETLMQELNRLVPQVPDALNRLFISSRVHLLFDFHMRADAMVEKKKAANGGKLGTTCKGIGPCYSSKAARLGIRVGDLLNWDTFEKKYNALLHFVESSYGIQFNDAQDELARHAVYAKKIQNQIVDGVEWLHSRLSLNKKILVEGANASLLDLDFGTYPFVTSSSTIAGGICTGLGLAPRHIGCVVGVIKSYTTRVGLGPFPTELHNELGEILRTRGAEYGTTTGRPRRCGWFDAPVVRYSILLNGVTQLNLTKLDVLSGLTSLQVCYAYKNKRTGLQLSSYCLPSTMEEYKDIEPLYETLPCWNESLCKCSVYEDLPQEAKNYLCYLEKLIECPIVWIGVGPDTSQTLYHNSTIKVNAC